MALESYHMDILGKFLLLPALNSFRKICGLSSGTGLESTYERGHANDR